MTPSAKHHVQAVIISAAWPSSTSGAGIAVLSCLRQCMRVFSAIHFIGLVDHPFRDKKNWRETNILSWSHLSVIRRPRWQRFLQSLLNAAPAITRQFSTKAVRREIRKILAEYTSETKRQQLVVLIFDIPPASLLFYLKDQFPSLPIAVYSHNVVCKGFETFMHEGSFLARLAWKIEIAKIHALEENIIKTADRFWTISETDNKEYYKRFHIQPHGILGVSLDINHYNNIPCGDNATVLYLGSADLRKGRGLARFIQLAWEPVRASFPTARFLLAGKNTERFTQREKGIYGLGVCEDERTFLSQGQIFINPQEIGSGVKLKSIVAMLAGKALVSTQVGVEGIVGLPGEHFLVEKNARELGQSLVQLLKDRELTIKIGNQAQELAKAAYNEDTLSATAQPLLEDLAMIGRKNIDLGCPL